MQFYENRVGCYSTPPSGNADFTSIPAQSQVRCLVTVYLLDGSMEPQRFTFVASSDLNAEEACAELQSAIRAQLPAGASISADCGLDDITKRDGFYSISLGT